MERRLPEVVATSGLEDLGLDLGVGCKLLFDDDGDAALNTEFG